MGELALQGRDKLTFVVSEPIASFGLWVEQLIAESTGKQGKGILPVAGRAARRAGRLRRRPRVRLPAQPGRAGRGRWTRRVEALGARRAPDRSRSPCTAPPTSAASSSSPSSRPRWRAGCSASTRSTSRTCRRPRTTPPRSSKAGDLPGRGPGRRSRSCSRKAAPPHYVAILGLRRRRRRSSTRRSPSCARRIRDAHQVRRPRSATGRASCTRPASSTRAARRPACSSSSYHDGDEDVEIPEAGYAFGHLKNAQALGDLQTLRATACRRCRSGSRATDPTDAVRRLALMQLGFVGLGKMGGNMVHRIHRDSDHECVAFDFITRTRVERGGGQRRDRRRRRSRTWSRSSRRRARSGSWCPAGDPTEQTVQTARGAARATATRSSTAATRAGPTTSAARRSSREQGHPLRGRRASSGGVWGLEVGYCMMVGGDDEAVERLTPDPRRARAADDRGARAGLGPLRPDRRRPLREDGPQRRGVRDDAGLRRGLLAVRRLRVRARQREDRPPLDAGLGRALVAVRAGRAARSSRRATTWPDSSRTSRTRARAAGRSRTRSTSASRCR